jgi:hypothetical protein
MAKPSAPGPVSATVDRPTAPRSGSIPNLGSAAAHSDEANRLSRLSAAHSARSAAMARDRERERPPSKRSKG